MDWTGDQGVHTGMTWTSMGGGPTAIGSEETTWDVPINWILGGSISATVEVILPEGDPSLYRVSLPNIRTIRGTNPSPGAVKGYIDSVMPPSTYWFAKRMANHESGYRQFGGDGMPLPNSGGDGGYGIFQLTPPRNPMNQVWDWKHNVLGGKTIIDEKKSPADAFWTTNHKEWVDYNNEHPASPAPPYPDHSPGAYCTFTFDSPPGSGKHPFKDANWIKAFNGAPGGHGGYYIFWLIDHWTISEWAEVPPDYTEKVYYVRNICSTPE